MIRKGGGAVMRKNEKLCHKYRKRERKRESEKEEHRVTAVEKPHQSAGPRMQNG